MTAVQVLEFHNLVKDVLDHISEKHTVKMWRDSNIETSIFKLIPVPQSARLKLEDVFPMYMTDAETSKAYQISDEIMYNIFNGACGIFMVFTTRDTVTTKMLKFENFQEREGESDDTPIKHCIVGEFIKTGPKEQKVMVTGVPLRVCSWCLEPLEESYKCSRCKERGVHVRYCGTECQRKHWGAHRVVCKGLGN